MTQRNHFKTSRKPHGLFDDWGVLWRVNSELEHLARETGVSLPVDLTPRKRSIRVEEIMKKCTEWPKSWQELAARLHADGWLSRFIATLLPHTLGSQQVLNVVNTVRTELTLVIIRLAGKWYPIGDRDNPNANWKGWIRLRLRHPKGGPTRFLRSCTELESSYSDDCIGLSQIVRDPGVTTPELRAAFSEALDSLEKADKQLLEMHLQGLSVTQIAAELGLHVGSVRRKSSRCIARLRRWLATWPSSA